MPPSSVLPRDGGGVALIFRASETFEFFGAINVSVVHGSILVGGCVVDETHGVQPMYSTTTHAPLQMAAPKTPLASLPDGVARGVEDVAAVVHVDPLPLGFLQTLSDLSGFQRIFDSSVAAPVAPGLCLYAAPHGHAPPLTISGNLENALNAVTEACLFPVGGTPPVVLAVGGKNAGKSTSLRVLLTRLALRRVPVAFLECDVGQSEFTAPGFISLNVITTPLFGAPFTHHQQPACAVYYGATSPRENPGYLIECISYVFRYYREHLAPRGIPLVVNTFGWIKGVGYDLLVSIASLLRCSHVLLLAGNAGRGMSDRFGATGFFGPDGTVFTPRVLLVPRDVSDSANSASSSSAMRFGPADHRLLSVAAALLAGNSQPLSARVPLAVPWSAVVVAFLHCHVADHEALWALNASTVALVIEERASAQLAGRAAALERDATDVAPLIVVADERPVPARCVGLGVVRAIDVEKQLFLVITSVPRELLANVNALVRASGAEIPAALFADANRALGGPYISFMAAEGTGSGARRPRHNIGKRSGR